jgi:hypothetical protein
MVTSPLALPAIGGRVRPEQLVGVLLDGDRHAVGLDLVHLASSRLLTSSISSGLFNR